MKIYILNGPNLNMLGRRDPEQYGSDTLEDIERYLAERFPNIEFTFGQSNIEGELVDTVQQLVDGEYAGLVGNFGGFSHTSVALRDALALLKIPYVEVHLSNIHAREEFRQHSITGQVASGIIAGFGKHSYMLGVQAVKQMVT